MAGSSRRGPDTEAGPGKSWTASGVIRRRRPRPMLSSAEGVPTARFRRIERTSRRSPRVPGRPRRRDDRVRRADSLEAPGKRLIVKPLAGANPPSGPRTGRGLTRSRPGVRAKPGPPPPARADRSPGCGSARRLPRATDAPRPADVSTRAARPTPIHNGPVAGACRARSPGRRLARRPRPLLESRPLRQELRGQSQGPRLVSLLAMGFGRAQREVGHSPCLAGVPGEPMPSASQINHKAWL